MPRPSTPASAREGAVCTGQLPGSARQPETASRCRGRAGWRLHRPQWVPRSCPYEEEPQRCPCLLPHASLLLPQQSGVLPRPARVPRGDAATGPIDTASPVDACQAHGASQCLPLQVKRPLSEQVSHQPRQLPGSEAHGHSESRGTARSDRRVQVRCRSELAESREKSGQRKEPPPLTGEGRGTGWCQGSATGAGAQHTSPSSTMPAGALRRDMVGEAHPSEGVPPPGASRMNVCSSKVLQTAGVMATECSSWRPKHVWRGLWWGGPG